MSDKLPKGWLATPVGELFSSHGGGTPNRGTASYWNGNIPWLSSGDIKAASISESSETITKRGLEESSARLCRKGSVIVVVRSGILKHTLPVALLERDAAINQDIKAFDSGDDNLNHWLAFAWRASARKLLGENREGTTVQSVKFETLRDFVLPIPPLAEQRRIVAKLEKLLGQVDACRQRLEKMPKLLKRFRQSILAAACSGRLTADWREEKDDTESSADLIHKILAERNKRYEVKCAKCNAVGDKPPKRPKNLTRAKITHDNLPDIPETWQWVCWDDLADWITYGFTRPMPHVAKGVPIITAKNVRDGYLDFAQPEFTTKEAFAELSDKDKPRRNEILITKDGAIRGRAALVKTDEQFCISQAVAVVRFGGLTAHEPFLLSVVRNRFTQNLIEAESMGTAIPHISITNFGRFPVPLPPLAEQQEIVRRVEGLFALADQLEQRLAQARRQVDQLTPSLLARAFAGKLVPQDPADEPAERLLERILGKPSRTAQKMKAKE